MEAKEVVTKIVVHPERCTGCLICQLQCSFLKMLIFKPSEARIKIDWEDDETKISFTDDCDECGVCVKYCIYGALTLVG